MHHQLCSATSSDVSFYSTELSSTSKGSDVSSVSSLTTPGGPGLTSPPKAITPHTSKPTTTSTVSLTSSA